MGTSARRNSLSEKSAVETLRSQLGEAFDISYNRHGHSHIGIIDGQNVDAVVSSLNDIVSCRELSTVGGDLSDAGLQMLNGMKSLESFRVRKTRLVGTGFDGLTDLNALKLLVLEGESLDGDRMLVAGGQPQPHITKYHPQYRVRLVATPPEEPGSGARRPHHSGIGAFSFNDGSKTESSNLASKLR